jgi:putative transposase
MPNYLRWRETGATYFFTVVTCRRRPLFLEPRARDALRKSLVEVRRRWPFKMFAAVLLPDHLHCIWTLPPSDDHFPIRWANVKRHTTQRYLAAGGHERCVTDSQSRHRERGIWQTRYWEHRVRDERELLALRDYIHLNPVKHGHTHDPLAWPWSSVHRHLAAGWLEPDWTGWTPIQASIVGE